MKIKSYKTYFDDIGYYVEMVENENKCTADFKVYVHDPLPNMILSGFLRFDGCCNFQFKDQLENCMIHTCTRKGLENIGVVLCRIWDLGEKIITNWGKGAK